MVTLKSVIGVSNPRDLWGQLPSQLL